MTKADFAFLVHSRLWIGLFLTGMSLALSTRAARIFDEGVRHPLYGEIEGIAWAAIAVGAMAGAASTGWWWYRRSWPRPGRKRTDIAVAVAVFATATAVSGGSIGLGLSVIAFSFGSTEPAELRRLRNPVRVLPGGEEAVLSTQFVKGVAEGVEMTLDAHPGIRTLYLHSPGGSASEGMAIAETVRRRKLRTRVLRGCNSACTHVFSFGVRREIRVGARMALGFHSGMSYGTWTSPTRSGRELTSVPLRQAGVAEWFVDKVADTPFDDIWHPDRDQLVESGVVDGTYGLYEGPGFLWLYEGAVEGRARTAVPDWLAPSLERAAPSVLADIRSFLTRSGHDARNERVTWDLWRTAAARVVARAVSRAPDHVALRAGGLLLSGMDRAKGESSAVCARLGAMPDLILAGKYALGPDRGGRDPLWRAFAEAAFSGFGPGGWPDGISLPDVADEATWAVRTGPDTPRETCAEMRTAYGEAVRRGDATGAAWLRGRFAAYAAVSHPPDKGAVASASP